VSICGCHLTIRQLRSTDTVLWVASGAAWGDEPGVGVPTERSFLSIILLSGLSCGWLEGIAPPVHPRRRACGHVWPTSAPMSQRGGLRGQNVDAL
jgi:hypothetical protein